MKWQDYYQAYWSVHDKELSDNMICVATKYRLPTLMQDELEDKDKDYRPVSHE